MNPAPKRGPGKQATSPGIRGRPIGPTNGPDRANLGHFAKRPSNFVEINPQSNLLSQKLLQESPRAFQKLRISPRRPASPPGPA